jgi:cytochrome c5
MKLLVIVLSAALLCACGERQATPPDAATFDPATAEPAAPALAEIYNRSCRSCHATGASLAPLTTDKAAWEPRLAQGMEVLLDHTINGYQGMPPMGMCFDCDAEQFEGLILFMAGQR